MGTARSSRRPLVLSLIFGVALPALLFGLFVVNLFYYPFTSATPNFVDVERVYDKMVVPDTWVKKGEGANKGIAGRQCPPFESDGCFSKVGTFTVPVGTAEEEVKAVFLSMGCPSVYSFRRETIGGSPSTSYECSVSNGVKVVGSLQENGSVSWDMYVNAGSR